MITDKWRQAVRDENTALREALGLPPRKAETPAEVQLDEGQMIKNQEEALTMNNAYPIIADTADIQAAPTSEDAPVVTACADLACFDSVHSHEPDESYFHTALVEKSDQYKHGASTWSVTIERLSSELTWVVCVEGADDLTSADALKLATATIAGATRALTLNTKAN